MSKFKIGEKVYIPKNGKWATVCGYLLNKLFVEDEDGQKGNIQEKFVEKFIEPKFKVGHKFFFTKDTNIEVEVVKASLNKKKKEYSYLCFDVKTGKEYAISESDIDPRCGTPAIEMTLEQVCRELGKNIKIKK